jgi:radial spoke head protein 9
MRSWFHFRSPQTEEGRSKIESDEVIFSSDFLDDLQGDLPKGVWSLQMANNGRDVNCRNLSWPGYYAFHKLGTNIFGSAYFGDGIKNVDLAFML